MRNLSLHRAGRYSISAWPMPLHKRVSPQVDVDRELTARNSSSKIEIQDHETTPESLDPGELPY